MHSNLIVAVYYWLNVLYSCRLKFVGKFGGKDVVGV